MAMTAGYSGTPLAQKLGLKPGSRGARRHAPDDYLQLIAPVPPDVTIGSDVTVATDIAHVFVDRKALLAKELAHLRSVLRPDATLWISWPKKASKVPTDITEDTIRDVALPLGFVDVKVCAVSTTWSGLKLVVRKTLR